MSTIPVTRTNPSIPGIRIHDPAGLARRPPQPLRDVLTLRDCYERFLSPDLDESAARTAQAYRNALNHWERLSGNPVLSAINNDTLRLFRAQLLKEQSPFTVNKVRRHLRAILRRVGPQADRNPYGRGLLDIVPVMRPALESPKDAAVIRAAAVEALYLACDGAVWPVRQPVPAPLLWKTVLVFWWNYGLRTQDLLQLEWANVDLSRRLFKFVAAKNRRKGAVFAKPRTMPLNDVTEAHLRAIAAAVQATGTKPARVFPFPRAQMRWYAEWKSLITAADVQEFSPRDLRETCNSRHEARYPGVGKWILGHAASGTNERYYLNPSAMIRRAIRKFPQPGAFKLLLGAADDRQKLLF